eukprot:6190767-Pleurochrysis_carterae.AAC.7
MDNNENDIYVLLPDASRRVNVGSKMYFENGILSHLKVASSLAWVIRPTHTDVRGDPPLS